MPLIPPAHHTEVSEQYRSNKATPNILNRNANPATDRLPLEEKTNAWSQGPPQALDLHPHHLDSSDAYPTLEDVQKSVDINHAAEIMAMHGECPSKEAALENLEKPAEELKHASSEAKPQDKNRLSEKPAAELKHAPSEAKPQDKNRPSEKPAAELKHASSDAKPQDKNRPSEKPAADKTNAKEEELRPHHLESSAAYPTLDDVQKSAEKSHAAEIMAMHGESPSKKAALETLEKKSKEDHDICLPKSAIGEQFTANRTLAHPKEAKRERTSKSLITDPLRWLKGEPRETAVERAIVRGLAFVLGFVLGSYLSAAWFVIGRLRLRGPATRATTFAAYSISGLNKAHKTLVSVVPFAGKFESMLMIGADRIREFYWQWLLYRLAYRIVLNVASLILKDLETTETIQAAARLWASAFHKDAPAAGSGRVTSSNADPKWRSSAEAEDESLMRQKKEADPMLRNRKLK